MLMRKLLKKQGIAPATIVTDKLRSYDSRSVNRYGHGPLVCKFPISVTVPASGIRTEEKGQLQNDQAG